MDGPQEDRIGQQQRRELRPDHHRLAAETIGGVTKPASKEASDSIRLPCSLKFPVRLCARFNRAAALRRNIH